MSELSLDDVQRHALAQQLQRVRVAQLVRREAPAHAGPGGAHARHVPGRPAAGAPAGARSRPVSLSELAEDDWIVASKDGFLVQACRDAGFDPRTVATPTEPLATHGLILRGIGIGWVPSLHIDDYGGIAIRPLKERMRRRDIYALLPPGDRHPRARQVIDAFVKTATDFLGAA